VTVQMLDSGWTPRVEELDDWQPAGGMLLDDQDDIAIEDELEDDGDHGRAWTTGTEEREVEDILSPGMLFGEGLQFRGEVIEPAVGKMGNGDGDDVGLPLRRGGSEVGQARRQGEEKKTYEVVRQLGSGSYAVVYLVREKGGRRREYGELVDVACPISALMSPALKCLSKEELDEDQIETQLFEATIHLSLPIHTNIVTLHQTLQTKKWLFLMLELCPGEDLFYWLEKSRDASPPPANAPLPDERHPHPMSSSKLSSSSIPFSSSQMFSGLNGHMSSSFTSSPGHAFLPAYGASPASLLFAHHNGSAHHGYGGSLSQTPPTPSLLSAFSANTLLSSRRLRLIASMFSQMCEAVAVCHDAGVSHRDVKPENFICCDSVELESVAEGDVDFGPQAKRKVVVKLTDFGLATTEEESGDVECGSKPYMSYECRNNLGPTYLPAPADVWSLGIVLINMLFHRNPWKDPTEGDSNFDNFLHDPTGFFLAKFTGIGREVATYLANHVLCVDVDARIGAREFGHWVKSLPEMIAGKRAVHALKMAKIETQKSAVDRGLFVKSPVETKQDKERKASTSALTSSAPPSAVPTTSAPTLSNLPPASLLSDHASTLPTPDLIADPEEEMKSATTIDEQLTPVDSSNAPSPESTAPGTLVDTDDARSLSTHKRRKRGVRKGKAAQAALAAAQAGDSPSREERDAVLHELASASQSLARDLSKFPRPFELDVSRVEDFPPLGTTPAQVAAQKKSRWKDMMKLSSGNPELAALRQRVAEREDSSGGNWSAPAKLQGDVKRYGVSMGGGYRSTATYSSGMSSALSSFGPVSSATSSMSGGAEDDDWRKPRIGEENRGRDELQGRRKDKRDESSRARKAAIAAAAITGNMDPMGSFGAGLGGLGAGPTHGKHGPLQGRNLAANPGQAGFPGVPHSRSAVSGATTRPPPMSGSSFTGQPLAAIPDETSSASKTPPAEMVFDQQLKEPRVALSTISIPPASSSYESTNTLLTRPTPGAGGSSVESSSTITITPTPPIQLGVTTESPNKPKIKGQIQSLAKMLSGLKTKGKD
jgi:serine/threonine protein kinase